MLTFTRGRSDRNHGCEEEGTAEGLPQSRGSHESRLYVQDSSDLPCCYQGDYSAIGQAPTSQAIDAPLQAKVLRPACGGANHGHECSESPGVFFWLTETRSGSVHFRQNTSLHSPGFAADRSWPQPRRPVRDDEGLPIAFRASPGAFDHCCRYSTWRILIPAAVQRAAHSLGRR